MEEVSREKTRIYVGGLGGGVTEDDLRKTFSSLGGEVISVDVVRTKDRSFAYLDFLPASDKSLPKLFSTYNGCMWKGGRLRLEKAKEHYLVKMKREWQEESELASKASENCNADASKNHDTVEKPKKPPPVDNTQIHIYFPKLGKVKSLAQVGIGKHKYSFQRIQVPSIPTHFCDCEEHSLAFPPPNKKQLSEINNASYEVNEQELNVMNSVMNKIFERANPSKHVIERSKSTNGKDELVAAETDEEDQLTDEDNLIINVASRKNDSTDLLAEMRAMMANQKPVAKKLNTSTEKPNRVNDNLRKEIVPLTKKRKSSHSEETSGNSQIRLDTQENRKKEVKLVTKQPENNSLRTLKSTWKDMIGQKRNTSFNIPEFIASIPQRKEEESKGDDTEEKNDSVGNKKRKLEGDKNDPGSRTEAGEVITENSIPKDYQQKDEEPKAQNLASPLAAIGQQFRISDVVAGDFDQTEKEPEIDDLDKKEEEPKTDDFAEKEEEPKTDDLAQTEEEPETDHLDQKEEEPETDDLDCNFGNHENDQDLKKPTKDSPVKTEEDLIRTARGEFWRHKSSWTQLISTASHSSFSISQIVPDISLGKHEQVNIFVSQPTNKNLDDQIPIVRKEATLPPVKKNIPDKKRILSLGNLESDETCSFMRNDESIKEWKKAKASSSGSLNKKKRLVKESALTH